METALVCRKPGAFDLHAAEGAHVDLAFRCPAPRTTPVFELGQLDRGLFDEVFDDILLTEPVTAAHRIVKVVVEAVIRTFDPCGTAFGGDRMATHRIDLRYQCNLQRRISFCHGNRRTQTGPSSSHDDYICLIAFHAKPFLAYANFVFPPAKLPQAKNVTKDPFNYGVFSTFEQILPEKTIPAARSSSLS